jgi:hypothetical protein
MARDHEYKASALHPFFTPHKPMACTVTSISHFKAIMHSTAIDVHKPAAKPAAKRRKAPEDHFSPSTGIHSRGANQLITKFGALLPMPTINQLVEQAVAQELSPAHWRSLIFNLCNNPNNVSRLSTGEWSSSHILHLVCNDPEQLAPLCIQNHRGRVRAACSGNAAGPASACPACARITLDVEFRVRSTGPGRKTEQVRFARCSACPYQELPNDQ